jgi:predicted lipoprotein
MVAPRFWREMKPHFLWGFTSLAALALLFWLFPLFHVVPLRQAQQQQQSQNFDHALFARNFWKEKLLPATEISPRISELWNALANDPAAARKQFGHSPGMSSVAYFLVQGSGRIAKTDKDGVQIKLDGTNPPIANLSTGLIFGNAVRDCTQLVNGSDFPNSQDFNDISTELNHIVETEVIPLLKEKAAPGRTVHFAGALEIEEGDVPKAPLITPVKVVIE